MVPNKLLFSNLATGIPGKIRQFVSYLKRDRLSVLLSWQSLSLFR